MASEKCEKDAEVFGRKRELFANLEPFQGINVASDEIG
jgi:hypothetical protein